MVILGQVFEYGAEDFTEGIDYIKVLNLADGTTRMLFLQVYPENIYHLVSVPGKGVLIDIDKWLVFWDTFDPEVVSWRVRMDTPAYITAIGNDRFLAVGKDLRSLFLYNVSDCKMNFSLTLDAKIVGAPLFQDNILLVPTIKGVYEVNLRSHVSQAFFRMDLGDNSSIKNYDEGFFLTDGKVIAKLKK